MLITALRYVQFRRTLYERPIEPHSNRQMSMPKPVGPNMAAATPSARREPRRRRSSTPGCSSWTRSRPPSASVFPEGAARKVSASVRRAHIRDTYAASGPGPGTWKDPDPPATEQPGIRGAQARHVCPGNGGYAKPAACPVSTISWRYGLRRTCRLVTGGSHRPRSTWPDWTRLALLAVTHRYKRAPCLWLEQFQIDSARTAIGVGAPCAVGRTPQFWLMLQAGPPYCRWYWADGIACRLWRWLVTIR
jgi:hypothetical protein